MARHPMSTADAAWLRMDRPQNLMVITSVLWFDRPLELGALRELLRERLVERFPRYAQRVVDGGTLGGARWEDDPDFDLDLHLHHRALPAPGDRAELQAFVADLMATPLDRSKPLWHCYLVDGYEGGSALVFRMHHCIADGIALSRVMLSLTDELPEGAPELEIDPARPEGRLGGTRGPLRPALAAGRAVAGTLVHESVETLLHPGHVRQLAGEAVGAVRTLAKELFTLSDHGFLHDATLHPGERVAWCDPVPLARIKTIAHEHEATVNDVLVAAVAGGLARWMARHGGADRDIHAMVPFNLRPLDRPLPAELGNRFGLVLLALPLLEPEPIGRLHEAKRRMTAIKTSPEAIVSYGFLASMGVAPPAVESRFIDFFSAKASLVLTNVPGPRHPVYLTGAQLQGVLVWAPCAGSVPMSVSVFSYDGEVTIGFMVDAGLVADPEAIVADVEDELAELQLSVPAVSV
jgi:diacylglycerol O-acyltransferase / wax synthase